MKTQIKIDWDRIIWKRIDCDIHEYWNVCGMKIMSGANTNLKNKMMAAIFEFNE